MDEPKSDFEKASEEKTVGVVAEIIGFLRDNKKWWLIPILIMMLVFGIIVALGATGAAPFIYTLF